MIMIIKRERRGTGGYTEGLKTPSQVGTLERPGPDPLRHGRLGCSKLSGAGMEQDRQPFPLRNHTAGP